MPLIPCRDNSPAPIIVELTEWDQKGPGEIRQLAGTSLAGNLSAQRLAESLRGRVNIQEGYQGLVIGSTSFVGSIDVGSIRIVVRPKLSAMPLAQLLRYAYGLRDIATFEETQTPTARHGLHDLLIAMLVAEVDELVHRGLARRYVSLSEKLESPRGRIDMNQLIRQGGIREANLPCQYFERRINWQLNQVLRAGLRLAARMSADRDLRRRVLRLEQMFAEVEPKPMLRVVDIDQAERGLTRLTAANAPALTIIRLLHDMLGVAFESAQEPSRMPGFLFDMNIFFQRLLSRFLHDNLTSERIEDERAIRNIFAYAFDGNPRGHSAPAQKPDYALFRGSTLRGFLDAKYRDIWGRGLPAHWLYQLAVYALASPAQVSVLLYASMDAEARDEHMEVRQPVSQPSRDPASVILRPVYLPRLAELLDPVRAGSLSSERRRLADELAVLGMRRSPQQEKRRDARAA